MFIKSFYAQNIIMRKFNFFFQKTLQKVKVHRFKKKNIAFITETQANKHYKSIIFYELNCKIVHLSHISKQSKLKTIKIKHKLMLDLLKYITGFL